MLSTVLVVVSRAVPLLLALLVLGCSVVGWLLIRAAPRSRRATSALVAVSGLVALGLTLYPDSSDRGAFCTVQFTWPDFGSVELLANGFLLFPLACFAVVLTRRPLAVVLAGSGLSALIELVQALVPVLQRSCDTSDWASNSVGAALGGLVAWWVGVLADRSPRPLRRPGGTGPHPGRWLRGAWIGSAAAGALLLGVALQPLVVPPARMPDACEEQAAGAITRLDGGWAVTAGASGGLCFRGPSGSSAFPSEIEPGAQGSDGTWEIGIEDPGTRSAADSAGRPVTLHAVAGTDLLVWVAKQAPTPPAPATSGSIRP